MLVVLPNYCHFTGKNWISSYIKWVRSRESVWNRWRILPEGIQGLLFVGDSSASHGLCIISYWQLLSVKTGKIVSVCWKITRASMCMYTLLSVLKCLLVLHENTHVLIRVFVFARMLAKEQFLAKSCRHEGTHCREQVDNVHWGTHPCLSVYVL